MWKSLPILIALTTASASAQVTDPRRADAACRAVAPPPAAFARFGQAAGPTTYLAVGQPRRVALMPVRGLRFAAPPERAPGADAVGVVLPLRIDRAGTYRVALSAPLWIDMVAGARRIPSGAHEMGPRCSAIRKIVDFRLSPGGHRLQLSAPRDRAGGGGEASVMIVRR